MTNNQKLKHLTLTPNVHQYTDFTEIEASSGVLDDLYALHDPSLPDWKRRIKRIHTLVNSSLTEKTSEAGVPFAMDISQELGNVTVDLGDVSRPAQAAGWAALQIYKKKLGLPQTEIYITDPDGVSAVWCDLITHQSKDDQTLPGILHVVKSAYDELYPHQRTTAIVGSIVGATCVEGFQQAWNISLLQERPIDAAHSLLDSGAFIASR